MDIVEVCRWLNREGSSACPCPWLPAISVFDDEEYEGHDLDLIRPRERLRIGRVLEAHGLRRRGARRFEGEGGRLELPRPSRSLTSDPADEIARVLERGDTVPFASPTQVLLMSVRRAGSQILEPLALDLAGLVHEHPVNFEKIDRLLQRAPVQRAYLALRPRLEAIQVEGIRLRRLRRFRSQLPR